MSICSSEKMADCSLVECNGLDLLIDGEKELRLL